MFSSTTPKRRSRKRSTEVWSNTSALTLPPFDQGEMAISGTRWPSPMGSPLDTSISPAVLTVERPTPSFHGGTGALAWS